LEQLLEGGKEPAVAWVGAHRSMRAGIRARLLLTRLLGVTVVLVVLASASHWSVNGPSIVASILFAFGALLVLAGIGGRVWALRHIAGRKKRQLVRTGPYSLCRHPLYFCSLLGGLGLVMCTGRISVVVLYLAASCFLVPAAIRTEEEFLAGRFPGYAAYRDEVPALLPLRPRSWQLGATVGDEDDDFNHERVVADRRVLRRVALESMTFLAPLLLFELLARAQAAGSLPILFVLP